MPHILANVFHKGIGKGATSEHFINPHLLHNRDVFGGKGAPDNKQDVVQTISPHLVHDLWRIDEMFTREITNSDHIRILVYGRLDDSLGCLVHTQVYHLHPGRQHCVLPGSSLPARRYCRIDIARHRNPPRHW